MNTTVLDFETYYDREFSLKKLTIPQYVHDPRFYVHGLAVRRPDESTAFRTDVVAALSELRAEFGENLQRTTIVCHNAPFDLYVLHHKYGIRPAYFTDTMFLAYHVHGRRDGAEGQDASLAALAERYSLPRKGELETCGLRQLSPQQGMDLASYAIRDVEITAALAELLLPQLTRPQVELPLLMHTIRLFTERGVQVDVPGIGAIETEIKEETDQLVRLTGSTPQELAGNQDFARILDSALARTGRKLPLKSGKKGFIPATAKTDVEMQQLLDDDDPAVAALVAARLQKKGEDQKLAKLATLRLIAQATGGVLPVYLAYFGSHTGRFAGGGKFNAQNLGRSGVGARMRELLTARPGHLLIIGDLAQIEARIVAWFAGQVDSLEAFRQDRDQYSEFAAATLHREVRKPRPEDPEELQSQLKAYRQVGKTAVLGLGFGMGALKFMNKLRADSAAAPLFGSGELTPLICRDIVRDYRSSYPNIPMFWEDLEDAARLAVDDVPSEVGRLRFDRNGDTTRIWLPSGRALRYANMRLEIILRTILYLDECGQQSEFTPEGPSLVYGRGTSLYGGKLCENVVQATARDVLAEAVLSLERRGYPVLFHVHDEVVVEVEQARAEEALHAVQEELSRVPEWAAGLPLACEVRSAERYGKE